MYFWELSILDTMVNLFFLKSLLQDKTTQEWQVYWKTLLISIPIGLVLKHFFELPNVYSQKTNYIECLKIGRIQISFNFLIGKTNKKRLGYLEIKPYFLFLYYDDFESGNPLGSHASFHKLDAVCASLPCIPVEYQSQLKNIFSASFQFSFTRFTAIWIFQNIFSFNWWMSSSWRKWYYNWTIWNVFLFCLHSCR